MDGGSAKTPRWSVVLRALREASGASQEGWAAQLGFGRSTVQRWESGDLPPGSEAEIALLKLCSERRLLRTFYQGALRGQTITAELIRDLLAEARLDTVRERHSRRGVSQLEPGSPPTPPTAASGASALVPPQLAQRSDLSLPRTSFVGRQHDLTEVQRLLEQHRLISLTGPGGAGKTRLALQVASTLSVGTWFVDLSAVARAELVPLALATALGLRDDANESALAAALRTLATVEGLLLLDNCEHVLEACAHLVDRLLSECPGIRVLTTTRQPLELADEVCWPLAGLELPPADPQPEALESVSASAAARLFVERAAAVQPGFALTPGNMRAVARICRQLDGLPLAIELAAARTRVVSPAQLAARLESHLRLLATSSISLPPRQQTLHAALDWSYVLLPEAERSLLRRLAIFAGGWSLEAAELVAGDLSGPAEVLDLLSSLVSRSLVVADVRGEHARYRLLETVRQYALEKLRALDEEPAAGDAHLDWCLALAEAAEPHLRGADQASWLDQLEEEVENVRAALSWALDGSRRVGDALRLASALRWFWFTRARPAEGRRWLEEGLAAADGVSASTRGKALDSAAALAHGQGAYADAQRLQDEGLTVWRADGDVRRMASALSTLGILAKARGEHERAAALMHEALGLARQSGESATEATVLNNLAALSMDVGEYAQAGEYLEQSLAIKRRLADTAGIATSLFNLGETAVHLGNYDAALELLSESLALFKRLGASHRIAQTLHSLGSVALHRDELETARSQFASARELFKGAGDGWGQALCVEGLAQVAERQDNHIRAARLFGAADAWRQANGAPIPPNDRVEYDRALEAVRSNLEHTAFSIAWVYGRDLGLDVSE
jgi:non-specific serine/threonine protein kinase